MTLRDSLSIRGEREDCGLLVLLLKEDAGEGEGGFETTGDRTDKSAVFSESKSMSLFKSKELSMEEKSREES